MNKINKLLPYQTEEVLEVGIDEAGRGCLFGRLYVAGVILPNNILELCEEEDIIIKDSKKMNNKNKNRAKEFIEKYALNYCVVYKDNNYIDEKNILRSTMNAMHDVINGLEIQPEKILVDGDHFNLYTTPSGEIINHECVIEGDNKYMSIAAASILAKTYKDEYIKNIVEEYPDLAKYDLLANSGYGTKNHLEAIKIHGISQFHRKTFGICKEYSLN
jgi:ribonuclease HII